MRLFGDVISSVDDPYFARALALAQRARGRTSPNPLVGCVIVRNGEVIGEGFHQCAGEAHAEVLALADAGDAARGSDVYVTLEPCAHFGKTPPCADALIAAGVRRVFIGMADPNPVAEGGAARLREAGVEVVFAADPRPFAELTEAWIKRIATGLPYVTVKVGFTMDAHPALHAGQRASITGESGAEVTRRLRVRHAAVAVSASTVIADDPVLTVRSAQGVAADAQPVRLVFVRETLPPLDARLFTDGAAKTVLVAPEHVDLGPFGTSGVGVVRYASDGGLRAMLTAISDEGIDSVLIEPGPRLFTALWNEQWFDRLVTVSVGGMAGAGAPALFLGGADAIDTTIQPRVVPVEAGIVGDVSVTVWCPRDVDFSTDSGGGFAVHRTS